MTSVQRKAVVFLFFLYGNAGPKYTQGNHEFLRRILAGDEHPDHYQPDEECKDSLQKVLLNDWSPLPVRQQMVMMEELKAHECTQ